MTALNKLPAYTKQQANRLEDIYLHGYKAEGLIGKGKVPANDNAKRGAFSLTPAGRARQMRTIAAKERTYNLIKDGHKTVKAVRETLKCTDTPVRRYVRQLEAEGRIEIEEISPIGEILWRVKQLSSLG